MKKLPIPPFFGVFFNIFLVGRRSPGEVLGKFACNLAVRVALGQAGPRRKPSPRSSHCSGGVNQSRICWESGGSVLGPAVFTGCWDPCLSKEDIFTNQEDAVMIKQFLASVAAEDERVRPIFPSCPRSPSVFAPPKPGRPTQICVFSHANTRMFGNFSPRVVATLEFAPCQRSANNKTEATSKIIKVSFLRTSRVLWFQSSEQERRNAQKWLKRVLWGG